MASLRDSRRRAKRLGLTVVKIPEGSKLAEKYRYRVNGFHAKNVAELNRAISITGRRQKQAEMARKLNGHRPKYGYKTVARKSRRKS